MKQKESDFLKFINRHFHVIIYSAYFFILMFFFYKAKLFSLFPFPVQGSEEFSILKAVREIQNGSYQPGDYNYSPFYLLFLSLLAYCSYGNLIIMRILQAGICSFIPVYIYKQARIMRLGRENAQIASFIYPLYGAAAMVSLSFVSTAMTSLFFLLFIYFLHKSFLSKRWYNYSISGFTGAFCFLFGGSFFLFIVLVLPFSFLFFKKIRTRVNKRNIIIFLSSFTLIVAILSLYITFIFTPFSFNYQPPGAFAVPKLTSIISSYEIPQTLSLYSYADIVDFMKIFIIPFNFLIIMSLFAFTLKKRAFTLAFIALSIFLYTLFILFPHNYYNYRVPVTPLMCVLSGGALLVIRNEKSKLKIITILLSISMFTLFTYQNPETLRPPDERRAVADILIKSARYEKATAYLDKLETEGIPSTDQWVELIKSICREGDVQWSLEVEYLFLQHLKKRTDWKLVIPLNPNENK